MATLERTSAESDKRPIDHNKYDEYYRTSLYVIRRGIDYGINLGYDIEENKIVADKVAYQLYMGQIHVTYSAILAENHRYYAAKAAIATAEQYSLNHTLLIADKVKAVNNELKKIPAYNNPNADYFAKQQLNKSIVNAYQEMTGGTFEATRKIDLYIILKIYNEVPTQYRDMYAAEIYDCLSHFNMSDNDQFIEDYSHLIQAFYRDYPTKPEKYRDVSELSLRDSTHKETPDEKAYAVWVACGNYSLSYLSFHPKRYLCYEYECDDLVFDFKSPKINLMMEDAIETYAHCRFHFFCATNFPSPIGNLAYYLSPKSKRFYNQELILDTYPRLYSILDKLSHIIMEKFDIVLLPKPGNKHAPPPSYNLIVQEINKKSNDNPYLQALCEILSEVNPRFIYEKQEGLPRYTMLPEAVYMDNIRHHIVHSGISFTEIAGNKKYDHDIAQITLREFVIRTHDLLVLVKEAILSTCLAIDYKDRHN